MKYIAGIDMKNGKVVHLTQGDLNSTLVHCDDPLSVIQTLEGTIIDRLHIVDIDGVFSGETQMFQQLETIRSSTELPIQFGGGIRSYETASRILNMGIEYIVIGTSAITDEELLIQLLEKYGSRIIVAADVYQGEVYIEGWEESSSTTIVEFLKTLELLNVSSVMITDISLDGTLSGINEAFVDQMIENTSLNIILSGGVGSDDDLNLLKAKRITGVVIGTALYEGNITL